MNFLKQQPLIHNSAKSMAQMITPVFQTRQFTIVQRMSLNYVDLTDALKTSFQTFCMRESKKFKA